VEKEELCPINDIQYVRNTFVNQFASNEWELLELPSDSDIINYIAISRKQDYRPIVDFKVDF
jgi:hypothetical protein